MIVGGKYYASIHNVYAMLLLCMFNNYTLYTAHKERVKSRLDSSLNSAGIDWIEIMQSIWWCSRKEADSHLYVMINKDSNRKLIYSFALCVDWADVHHKIECSVASKSWSTSFDDVVWVCTKFSGKKEPSSTLLNCFVRSFSAEENGERICRQIKIKNK